MNLLLPAIALLRPLSAQLRFWVLPLPMIVVLLAIVAMSSTQVVTQDQQATVFALLALAGLVLWLYFQLASFCITGLENDHMDNAMTAVSHGNLAQQVSGNVRTLGHFGRHLELMITNMSSMVANIRTATVLLGDTGEKLVEDSRALPSALRHSANTFSKPPCTSSM